MKSPLAARHPVRLAYFILLAFFMVSCATVEPERSGSEGAPAADARPAQSGPAGGPPPADGTTSAEDRESEKNPVPASVPESRGPAENPQAALLTQLAAYPQLAAGRNITLRIFPQDAEVLAMSNGHLKPLRPVSTTKDTSFFTTDASALLFRAPGYESMIVPAGKDQKTAEIKLEKSSLPLQYAGEALTGYQPKSVRFAPDGKSVFVAHLSDSTALSQYELNPLKKIRDLNVPMEYRKASGFVETVILPARNEIWVSQMTRNTIHVFDLSGGDYITSISVSGNWPKVLLASVDEKRVWVSCWDSDRVVEIDTNSRKETRYFSTSGTPRGLALTPDGSGLLVTIYSSSGVDLVDLKTGIRKATWDAAPGRTYAMRHIVHDNTRGEYYITAMGTTRVYRLSESGEWLGWWAVGEKPNSCSLSPDGAYLFVSCRGPNNPDDGYLVKGYEFGKVYIINLKSGLVEGWIWGRDQTTGLDVSPDGRYLAFTDFLSRNLELYRIR